MKLTVALTVLLITQAIAENDDLKDVEDVDVKSAEIEDNAKLVDELSHSALDESYTVPVEVVRDAVTESEAVKQADTSEYQEDSRVERSTVSDANDDDSGLKSLENDMILPESEHITDRRSNDETLKAVNDDDKLENDDDAEERSEKLEVEEENDDELKTGSEEAEQRGDLQAEGVDADEAVPVEKSAVEDTSTVDIEEIEKVAKVEDVTSLVTEVVQDLVVGNLYNRRMLDSTHPILDIKAMTEDEVGVSDDEISMKSGVDEASESEETRSFDSSRPFTSQTLSSPLIPLQNKQNFFLSSVQPLQTPHFGLSTQTQTPLRSLPTRFPLRETLPMKFFPSTEHNPYNGFSSQSFINSPVLPQLPSSTTRPVIPHLPLANLPSFEELFRKARNDLKSQENLNQYQNMGFNRRIGLVIPKYLRYGQV